MGSNPAGAPKHFCVEVARSCILSLCLILPRYSASSHSPIHVFELIVDGMASVCGCSSLYVDFFWVYPTSCPKAAGIGSTPSLTSQKVKKVVEG